MTPRYILWVITLITVLTLCSIPNKALALTDTDNLKEELGRLITNGNQLANEINNTLLTPLNLDREIAKLESSLSQFQEDVMEVYQHILASDERLTLDQPLLQLTQDITTVALTLAQGIFDLSKQLINIAPATALSALDSALKAMLRLSDDIGIMADRILEMADKILIMADNIGIMADRILETQIIQSANLKLVVDAVMQTQQNCITLLTNLL